MAHEHPIYDTDPHFKIDGDTRIIINASDVKVALMQGDHNSERFTFEIPRYVDGHDMSLCNICQIHYLNVASSTRATNSGIYEVEDLQFDPKDEQNRVVLSWLISSNVTMYVGSLSFVIRFGCSTDGVVDYIWNTAVHSGITISSSICNSETVVQDYTDILEQWRDKLFSTYESIIDKTLTKSGQAADAKVTGDSVTALKEDLDNIAFIGFQYLDSTKGERSKYYTTYENIKSVGDSNYVAFPIISLSAGKYYVQNLSDVFTFLDDGTALKNFSGYNSDDKTLVLETSRKISVTGLGDSQTPMTISNIEVNDNKYGVVYVKIIGDNTSERIQTAENNIKSLDKKIESITSAEKSEKRHVITVGIGKNFTSIKDAVASITDSSKNNIYDIYIDDGIYEEYAITLPDYVNLIGVSGNREKCIIKGELSDSASANEITVNSTLNLKDSNVLENLTITAKNLRYPIHSESGGTHTNWIQILNNCYVEHFGNTAPNNTWTSYHAWGEGASSGAYAEFNNCVFKSPAEPWYVHEFAYLPDIPKPYHHILNNCQIINTTVSNTALWISTAKIDNTKNSNIINTIDFNNCNFYNGEISVNDICAININIHGGNNAAIRFKNSCPDTDYTNIKTYIGEETITRNTVLKYVNGINLVEKANANTPADMIAGIAAESCEPNSLVKIIKGSYIQNAGRIGNKAYCDNNGQIANTGSIEIGTYYGEFLLVN